MQRILIGSALVTLCAVVAYAQSPNVPGKPPGSPSIMPGTLAPGTITPGGSMQTTVPPAKKVTTPVTPGIIAPDSLRTPRFQTQSLAMANGTAFNAVFDRNSNSFKAPLADGTYQLNNGGAIRVRGGVIVWDAFGVIDRLNAQAKKGQRVAEGPAGLG